MRKKPKLPFLSEEELDAEEEEEPEPIPPG